MLLLLACVREPEIDSGSNFTVVGSSPEDGDEEVSEAALPELRLSEPGDVTTCAGAARLDAVDAEGQVLFPVVTTTVFSSSDEKLQLEHDIPLHRGYDFALTLNGECTSLDGEVVAPFFARFRVP